MSAVGNFSVELLPVSGRSPFFFFFFSLDYINVKNERQTTPFRLEINSPTIPASDSHILTLRFNTKVKMKEAGGGGGLSISLTNNGSL